MASADFTAWLAETAAERVILCDLQLAEQTAGDGWASEGSNVYSLSDVSNFNGSGGDGNGRAEFRQQTGFVSHLTGMSHDFRPVGHQPAGSLEFSFIPPA